MARIKQNKKSQFSVQTLGDIDSVGGARVQHSWVGIYIAHEVLQVVTHQGNSNYNTTMTVATQAGRYGNLTPEQTLKLKDMWAHLLGAMGVLDEATAKQLSASVHTGGAAASEAPAPKKSGGGLFGRKKAPEPEEDLANQASFKDVLGTISIEQLRLAFWNMVRCDNPDNLLLRFLRARKWDVPKALSMMAATFKWRLQEGDVEEIEFKGELGALKENDEEFLLQLRSKKAYIHGRDLEGRPIVYVRPRFHNPKAQKEKCIENFTVHIIETARLTLNDPVDTAGVLFDLSGFALSNMDYAAVKFIIKCFEAHYPECLGVLLIHKAPWIFSGIWNIIKNWLDPVVASKIHFTKNTADLEKYIPKKYIPKELGGDDPFVYEYIEPKEGEGDRLQDEATRNQMLQERISIYGGLEKNTIDWIKSSKANEGPILQERTELTKKLRSQYWQIDPYLRAPSILDRLGEITYA